MRTVFNNSQLAHVWANQSQTNGRSGSMFFRDSMIFSYGEHYMAAKIHTLKGKTFALVNSNRYSVTTAQHLGEIRSALRGLMPYFESTDVTDTKAALKHLTSNAKESALSYLRVSKVTSKEHVKHAFESIRGEYKELNKFRAILGLSEVWPAKKELDAVEKHLNQRLKRYHELNTPEMIAKREAQKAKRDAAKAKKLELEQAERIEKFRRGETVYGIDLPFELLRVQGDEVVTSRGARVPLKEALGLLNAIESGETSENLKGAEIGSFQVTAVYPHLDSNSVPDKLLHIGCHRILLSEARQVLSKARHLSLVS